MPGRHYPPPLARFMARVQVADNGCWLWTGSTHHDLDGVSTGYGYFWADKKRVFAHRWIYAQLVGPIPEGMQIDHLCHNTASDCPGGATCLHRSCVNPAHLEPATPRTNTLRGKGAAAVNAAKTHCKRGHELSGDNLIGDKNGYRRCRACARLLLDPVASREYQRRYMLEYRQGLRRRKPKG